MLCGTLIRLACPGRCGTPSQPEHATRGLDVNVPPGSSALSTRARFRGPLVAQTSIGRLAQPYEARSRSEPKAPANGAVPRRSSLHVVVPDSACHAGGRRFESRRSRSLPPLAWPNWTHSTTTRNRLALSATYVASSAALPLPTFFTAWIRFGRDEQGRRRLRASSAGLPSTRYSSDPTNGASGLIVDAALDDLASGDAQIVPLEVPDPRRLLHGAAHVSSLVLLLADIMIARRAPLVSLRQEPGAAPRPVHAAHPVASAH